jgi:hypothetical protein
MLQLNQVSLSDLDVTSGPILEQELGLLSVNEPIIRATKRTGTEQVACLQFHYLGPTSNRVSSASGIEFHQIGLKLRSKDPCNLVYVMWRIQPTYELIVQVKRNEGVSTSQQCGGNGYSDVARIPFQPFVFGQLNELLAWVQTDSNGHSEIHCWVNHQEVIRAPIDVQGIDGPTGIRSDNGQYNFRFFTAI